MGKKERKPGSSYTQRGKILATLGFASYGAYLSSPLWRSIRRQVLKVSPRCILCDGKATQVHHTNYSAETLSGGSTHALKSMCGDCHIEIEFTDGKKLSLFRSNKKLAFLLKARAETKTAQQKTGPGPQSQPAAKPEPKLSEWQRLMKKWDEERAARKAAGTAASKLAREKAAAERRAAHQAAEEKNRRRREEQRERAAILKAQRDKAPPAEPVSLPDPTPPPANPLRTVVAGRVVTDKERGMGWENVNCRPVSKRYPKSPASGIKITPPPPKPLTLREQIEEQRRRLRARNFA